jgi:hypothetical protein
MNRKVSEEQPKEGTSVKLKTMRSAARSTVSRKSLKDLSAETDAGKIKGGATDEIIVAADGTRGHVKP